MSLMPDVQRSGVGGQVRAIGKEIDGDGYTYILLEGMYSIRGRQ